MTRQQTLYAWALIVGALLATLLMLGCAAGDPRFSSDAPAGFWFGLWHGVISFVSLVIGIFSDGVRVYEVHNSGGWYDFGFLLGITCIWGSHATVRHRSRRRARRDEAWREVAREIERGVREVIREWARDEHGDDGDVVADRVLHQLKQNVRGWAEEAGRPDAAVAVERGAPDGS